ncbi:MULTISPECIES: cytochrome ubiquinol oxidase subunit I [Micromonospora]|uniref:Cytochrome ubiquinol oxidase subunit I n=1 Tax=Micromonospora solifontis TaxID=2487138 RepID=A0ABX9WM24_9ACTN|nr:MULTISPECIES: cytochrome ubiquinol oxidase subunit I [Micromonospora]NES14398.1 cytochrome ubiquinol oxidase subunit I [Micromonospora sp. PPF5-17B]NES34994.1 cytochrome ubiquinol oxidase subunit I [Micromonospora solifontis]NES57505.1 cytochrome ubiquinol oxidase subunit I [Micromonospora sp. PPF5-6]RNM01266.1 cytochrome ubiquinol oxidase subunit I [Micromonospora solifontis]
MDTLFLARLQFAATTSIHFLFVAVTLGLVTLLVGVQTAGFVTGKPVYERLTRFWGQLYVINYVLGIATGLVMEFQFGLNWSGLSRYVGNVFGAPLAVETLVAFVLESTFLGMWIFGWHRLRRGVHLALLWGVALTAYASAFWVLVGNAWLQHPVGYEIRDGVAHLTDFGALLTNPTLGFAFGHVVAASLVTGGMLMSAVSAFHLIRRTPDFALFRKSLRIGLLTTAAAVVLLIGFGFAQFGPVGQVQPTKFGGGPDRDALVAEWTAKFGPGDYVPPTLSNVGLGFMILIGFGLFFGLLIVPLLWRDWLIRLRFPLWVVLLALPFPFVAVILGWIAREVGRQPWAVYGLLPVDRAVSPVGSGLMLTSLVGFTLLLGALAVTNWVLLARHAARGAADPALGRPPAPDTDTHPQPVFA